MPDVLSIALGGGTIVHGSPPTLGPESVGYRLTNEGLVFGGNTLTTTDLAVAGGIAALGDPSIAKQIDKSLVKAGLENIREKLESIIDQLKLSAADVPVVLVGGGSILVGDSLDGASEVIRPQHSEVANAIGAAMAQVGGHVEKVYSLAEMNRDEALASAREEAEARAIAAGARPDSLEVVELEEVPLTYLPSNATRIRIKVVGDLATVTS